jgi:competence protein ComGC
MKGVYLIVMLISLLIVSLLVMKNISKHETLQEDVSQIEALDRAKGAAELLDRKREEMQKQIDDLSR